VTAVVLASDGDIMDKNSELPGFHKLSPEERLDIVRGFAGLEEEDLKALKDTGRLDLDTACMMIENVIGTMEIPLGVATNFRINGKDVLIPMAIEEPSVVAAASNAAKLARPGGGFEASTDEPVMIGQIQLVGVTDTEGAIKAVMSKKQEIIELCNKQDSTLVRFGGGARDVEVRGIETEQGRMLVVHVMVDVRDAMGANAINTMAEKITPLLEELSGGRAKLRIISNLATRRLARARAVWKRDAIGEDTVQGILEAYAFACADQYRCATHNKGIMNGIDAVTVATGNDFRAVEAGAHSFAAFERSYTSLTRYERDGEGNLVGTIELPIAVGTVGGATRTNPVARTALRILGIESARGLAQVMAAVGLAQNFAALRALATEGIQHGHMKLHAKNIAVLAGATFKDIDRVAARMIEENDISAARAEQILGDISGQP
jgi:hydroxymethylglutaryl-CoA reductase